MFHTETIPCAPLAGCLTVTPVDFQRTCTPHQKERARRAGQRPRWNCRGSNGSNRRPTPHLTARVRHLPTRIVRPSNSMIIPYLPRKGSEKPSQHRVIAAKTGHIPLTLQMDRSTSLRHALQWSMFQMRLEEVLMAFWVVISPCQERIPSPGQT